jgi:DUF971 family protein
LNQSKDVPVRIDIKTDASEMEIEWGNGDIHQLSLEGVRSFCPCALCVANRDSQGQKSELHVLSSNEEAVTAKVEGVTSVGRYAIQIKWADGHDTGIYTFDYLKSLWEQDSN